MLFELHQIAHHMRWRKVGALRGWRGRQIGRQFRGLWHGFLLLPGVSCSIDALCRVRLASFAWLSSVAFGFAETTGLTGPVDMTALCRRSLDSTRHVIYAVIQASDTIRIFPKLFPGVVENQVGRNYAQVLIPWAHRRSTNCSGLTVQP